MVFSEPDEDTGAFYSVLNVSRTATTEEITKAYRKLAQVFHPDKHSDEAKRKQAQESFSKVQEAYEVLSDQHRRQIYDVYGKAGLQAGLQVGEHLGSQDEVRKQWEDFMAKRKEAQQDQSVVQKSQYSCRIDARRLVQGKGLGQGPLFRGVTAQSSVEAVVGERNVVSMLGTAAVRTAVRKTPQGLEELPLGGGNVVAGYKRNISDDDWMDISGQVGLQSLISVTTTRRLCKLSNRHAWLSSSWGPMSGFGMEAGCSQNLFNSRAEGSLHWVLGPAGAAGMASTITKRGNGWSIQGKIEVGAVHAVSLRGTWVIREGVSARAVARVGTTGVDLELGLTRRWSPQLAGYVGTLIGFPAGVQLKLKATRTTHTFECPILLSSSFTDWKVATAAYVLPPLTYLAISRLVVRPLLAWSKASHDKAVRDEMSEATRAALEKAQDEQALIEAVAKRKIASELAVSAGAGVVVVVAVYGLLDEYRQHVSEFGLGVDASHQTGRSDHTFHTISSEGVTRDVTPPQSLSSHHLDVPDSLDADGGSSPGIAGPAGTQTQSSNTQPQTDETAGSGSAQAGTAAGEGADAQQQQAQRSTKKKAPPPAWMDVTLPLQYLVANSQLVLHEGMPKHGLMGFADPAPHSSDKQLSVMYWNQGLFWEVVVGDTDALVLPGAGSTVTDNSQLLWLQARLQRLQQTSR